MWTFVAAIARSLARAARVENPHICCLGCENTKSERARERGRESESRGARERRSERERVRARERGNERAR